MESTRRHRCGAGRNTRASASNASKRQQRQQTPATPANASNASKRQQRQQTPATPATPANANNASKRQQTPASASNASKRQQRQQTSAAAAQHRDRRRGKRGFTPWPTQNRRTSAGALTDAAADDVENRCFHPRCQGIAALRCQGIAALRRSGTWLPGPWLQSNQSLQSNHSNQNLQSNQILGFRATRDLASEQPEAWLQSNQSVGFRATRAFRAIRALASKQPEPWLQSNQSLGFRATRAFALAQAQEPWCPEAKFTSAPRDKVHKCSQSHRSLSTPCSMLCASWCQHSAALLSTQDASAAINARHKRAHGHRTPPLPWTQDARAATLLAHQ